MKNAEDNAKQKIKAAVESGRLSHAILIISDEAVCKEVALYTAGLVLSKNREKLTDCGDFLSFDAKTFKVADSDELLGELSVTPASGKRIIIFSNAGHMSQTVQNMLLKTIEEPPAGNHFIFYGNPGGLLPTIRSRCATLTTGELSYLDIADYIADIAESADDAMFFARLSGGSVSIARQLCENSDFLNYCLSCADFICNLKTRSLVSEKMKDFAAEDGLLAVTMFELSLSDMQKIKNGFEPFVFTRQPICERIKRCVEKLTKKEISDVLLLLRDARKSIFTNVPARQVLDNFAAKTEQVVNYGRK